MLGQLGFIKPWLRSARRMHPKCSMRTLQHAEFMSLLPWLFTPFLWTQGCRFLIQVDTLVAVVKEGKF
jgi:hypothetical protein